MLQKTGVFLISFVILLSNFLRLYSIRFLCLMDSLIYWIEKVVETLKKEQTFRKFAKQLNECVFIFI
jgi:hypothetical protein